MYRLNNDLKVLEKYKSYLKYLDNLIENIPRKDFYYKDYIRNISYQSLEEILLFINNDNTNIIKIETKFSVLDVLIERLYDKKYISENNAYKLVNMLIEIKKMVKGIKNYRENNGS